MVTFLLWVCAAASVLLLSCSSLAFKIPVTIDGHISHLSFDPTLDSLDSQQIVVGFLEQNNKGYSDKHVDVLVKVVSGINEEYRDAYADPRRLIAFGKRLKSLKAFEDAAKIY